MKQILSIISFIALTFSAYALGDKLDGYSRWQLALQSRAALSVDAGEAADGTSRTAVSGSRKSARSIRAFIKADAGFDALACGLSELRRFGDWLLVEGSAEACADAAELAEVQYVSFARPMEKTNNRSAATLGVDAVHSGRGLEGGTGYTGSGVVAGIFDIGFDFCNPAFCDAAGESRIRKVFQFDEDGKVSLSDSPSAIAALITDDAEDCHGSHVLGTMAGRGGMAGRQAVLNADGSVRVEEGLLPFGGMASDADIYIGAGPLTDANIAGGVAAIVDAADGAPCVVNLSLSDPLGPRDGSDAFAQAISSLTDDAVIVVSAGNDTGLGRSLSATFGSDTPWLGTFLRPVGWKSDAAGTAAVWSGFNGDVDLYIVVVDTGSKKELARIKAPVDPDGEPLVISSLDYEPFEGGPDAAPNEAFDRAYTGSWLAVVPERAPSGRLGWYIPFYINIRPENEHAYIAVGLVAEGRDGQTVDMHLSAPYANFLWLWVNGYRSGCDDLSVTSLGAADGVVCVGASTGMIDYGCLDGTAGQIWEAENYTLGDVAPFSSYGTLRTGLGLPHVVAPGAQVVSVYSTPYAKEHDDYDIVAESVTDGYPCYWTPMYGTSMSSPAVAGAIALWLEADPSLTSADIHDIIRATAAIPSGSQYGSERWGAGMFNAYAGMQEVLNRRAALAGPSAVESRGIVAAVSCGELHITVPGRDSFDGAIYDTFGRLVSRFSTVSGTASVSVPGPGVYIISTSGHSLRLAV